MNYVDAIRKSGLSIYDPIEIGGPLYIPTHDLEKLLNKGLRGFSTQGLPNRTRSKVVKSRVCEILGYPVPASFQKTQPRFSGQNFDIYIQASNNLQLWNEEINPNRRYVLIREEDGILTRVRVVTGDTLAILDTTGTLTQKYQARIPDMTMAELVSAADTEPLRPLVHSQALLFTERPTDTPTPGKLLTVADIFRRLKPLVGQKFADLGRNQERNRGAALRKLVCSQLGYTHYADDGQFPDLKHQLLEIKLQTAATIDLGLASPDSTEPLDNVKLGGTLIRHCDVRYAIFPAMTNGTTVTITGLFLISSCDFFARFPRYEGKVINKKLQIPLPKGFL